MVPSPQCPGISPISSLLVLLAMYYPLSLSLSVSMLPILSRIVQQVQTGRYIDMRDLLGDNVAIRRQLDVNGAMGAHVLQVSSRPRVREVTTMPSWVCCYLTFLVVGTTDPATRDRLTYAILLVKEFLKHGGQGWLEYDRLFRQQAALNPGLPWNVIHPSLHVATTILGQRSAGSGAPYARRANTWYHSVLCPNSNIKSLRSSQCEAGDVARDKFALRGTTELVPIQATAHTVMSVLTATTRQTN